MVLERTVVKNFRDEVKKLGGRTIKTHGENLMSLEPDIIGCLSGYLFAAEAKKDSKNKPTKGQEYCLLEWKKAGAITFVFWEWKAAIEYLKEQVEYLDNPFLLKTGRIYEGVIPY